MSRKSGSIHIPGEQGSTMEESVIFFPSPAQLRAWYRKHHAIRTELWIGFHRKNSGQSSITWPESVDEALCVGWIDGIRKRIDESRYKIRFTPRKSSSVWSAVNIGRVKELSRQKRMTPAGERAFALRKENKSGIYAYEQRSAEFPSEIEREFRRNKTAWAFFAAQPPGYRKKLIWWVISAKKELTRQERLQKLTIASANGLRL